MKGGALGAVRTPAVVAATGTGFYALSYLVLHFTRQGYNVAAIWPADAMAMCAMLRLSRNGLEDAALFLAVVVASVWAAHDIRADQFLSTTFALVNAGEVAMAVLLARLFAPVVFPRAVDGWKFCAIVGLAPPAVGAVVAALSIASMAGGDALITARNWFLADLMGFLLVGPFGMTLGWKQLRQLKLGRRWLEALGLAAGVAAGAGVVFGQTLLPLGFLILPAGLWATYRFRLWGAAGVALIVTAIAVPATVAGSGPYGMGADLDTRLLLLQAMLALNSLTCVVLAALLNERDLHRALIERRGDASLDMQKAA